MHSSEGGATRPAMFAGVQAGSTGSPVPEDMTGEHVDLAPRITEEGAIR
jgi:hypothetical protein